MRIEIERLNAPGFPFAHTYAPAELDLEDERARLLTAAHIEGRASLKRERVHVNGTITTTVEAYCDRCLTPLTVPLNVAFDVNYDPPSAAPDAEGTELQPEDLTASVYEGEALDVDELVREQVLLALPMRQLCAADCQGLCPTCGGNMNTQPCTCAQPEVDPRWAGLAALKDDKA